MKYHKIRNVALETCTAEQKIAYNIAFTAHINYGDQFSKLQCEVTRSEAIGEIIRREMKGYKNAYTYKPGKYDEDSIFCCLNAGLQKYLLKPFIASDYETIGKAFPAYYLNA